MKTFAHLWQYVDEFFLEWEIFLDKRCRANENTHFMSNKVFPKIVPLMR